MFEHFNRRVIYPHSLRKISPRRSRSQFVTMKSLKIIKATHTNNYLPLVLGKKEYDSPHHLLICQNKKTKNFGFVFCLLSHDYHCGIHQKVISWEGAVEEKVLGVWLTWSIFWERPFEKDLPGYWDKMEKCCYSYLMDRFFYQDWGDLDYSPLGVWSWLDFGATYIFEINHNQKW